MAYVYNGTSRSLRVTVTKKLGGVTVIGYPRVYNGQNYWGNALYQTLADTQMKQLSDAEFAARYAAFVAYVEFKEQGCDFDFDVVGDGAIKTDSSCETMFATWWATGNTGQCDDPCGQQVYTAEQYAGNPLTISYFYNTPSLIPNDYYTPGAGVIGFTDESYGMVKYTADIAVDGAMSGNAICEEEQPVTTLPPWVQWFVRLSNGVPANACSGTPAYVYTLGDKTFMPGDVLYTSTALDTPVQGYAYVICPIVTNAVYALDDTTGIIGLDTGETC